ncbi:MAG: monovalent cation/H+ antiporter complex subunit F [Luteolibacter sp.]
MTIFLIVCFVFLVAASALALYRLLAGPTLLDRIIGFDMGAICIVAMIIVLSVYRNTQIFIEIMLIFSLLGFVGTVSFVSYLYRNPDRLWHRSEMRGRRKEKEANDA